MHERKRRPYMAPYQHKSFASFSLAQDKNHHALRCLSFLICFAFWSAPSLKPPDYCCSCFLSLCVCRLSLPWASCWLARYFACYALLLVLCFLASFSLVLHSRFPPPSFFHPHLPLFIHTQKNALAPTVVVYALHVVRPLCSDPSPSFPSLLPSFPPSLRAHIATPKGVHCCPPSLPPSCPPSPKAPRRTGARAGRREGGRSCMEKKGACLGGGGEERDHL